MPFSTAASTIRCTSSGHIAFGGVTALPVSAWVLAAILAAVPVASWGRYSSVATFNQAYRSYCSVLKNKQASRGEWLHVIDELVASGRPASKGVRHTGLLYAGRACIELFRRSGRHEDLDRAIRLFDELKTVTRNDEEWITALKELKLAYTLRGRAAGSRSRLGNRVRVAHRAPAYRQIGASKRVVAPSGPRASTPPFPGKEIEPGPRSFVRQKPAAIQGNPFYFQRGCPAARPAQRVRQAAIQPPASIVDATIKPEVHIVPAPVPQAPKPSLDFPVPKPKRQFIVVIDPGHGGKDPGAVSSDGKLKEKDVTLALAKRIKAQLEARSRATGITVSLTRSDDSFLTVSERTARANAANGDLFISIHCNAYSDSSASGVETYYLSKARSKRAMMVAARENGIPLSRMTDVEATLLDLVITSKRSESEKLAQTVHESLIGTLHLSRPRMDRGVKQAPFYVLVGVAVPAVLVECAYMSNSRESARLADPRYLHLVARGISRGAEAYVKGLQEGCGRDLSRR